MSPSEVKTVGQVFTLHHLWHSVMVFCPQFRDTWWPCLWLGMRKHVTQDSYRELWGFLLGWPRDPVRASGLHEMMMPRLELPQAFCDLKTPRCSCL